jgi:hypothetical protein
VGRVARIRKRRNTYEFFILKYFKVKNINWRITLRLNLDKYAVRVEKGIIWLRMELSGEFL